MSSECQTLAFPLRGVRDSQVCKCHVQREALPYVSLHVWDVHQEARRHTHQSLQNGEVFTSHPR